MPHLDEPGEGQRCQGQGDQGIHTLDQDHEPPPVDTVGHDSSGELEYQRGQAADQTGETGQQGEPVRS